MDLLLLVWAIFWIWLGWFLTAAINRSRLP